MGFDLLSRAACSEGSPCCRKTEQRIVPLSAGVPAKVRYEGALYLKGLVGDLQVDARELQLGGDSVDAETVRVLEVLPRGWALVRIVALDYVVRLSLYLVGVK